MAKPTTKYSAIAGPETLILAEKPSVAADIAAALGKVKSRRNGCIELEDGTVVSNAVGHLVELASPEEHNPEWGKRWNWGQLPMIPDKFKYAPVERTKPLYQTVMGLFKKAKILIIATDAGREGELIARELVEVAKWRGKIYRFWGSSMLPEDIRRQFNELLDGDEKRPLYEAALARSHIDNIYGFTGSRAASLSAKVGGQTFPMGRVQTPVMSMVAERTMANRAFNKSFFYEVTAAVQTSSGATLQMKHAPKDKEKILDKRIAEDLIRSLQALPGGPTGPLKQTITPKSKAAPLPFSILTLQRAGNRVYSWTAARTLEIAQSLYESKFITYPRTDFEHLFDSQKVTMEPTLDAIAVYFPDEVAKLRAAGVQLRASTFDDSKIGDHHGLIPTVKPAPTLSGPEAQLYRLICAQLLMALAHDFLYDSMLITMDLGGERFEARGKRDTRLGWAEFRNLR